MKIQISLVGNEILPVYYGVIKFSCDVLCLFCSEQSETVARQAVQMAPKEVRTDVFIVDPYDVDSVKAAASKAFERYPGNYVLNLTGGTKIMALSLVTDDVAQNADVAYFTQDGKVIDLKTGASTVHGLRLNLETMFRCTDNSVQSKMVVKEITARRLTASRSIAIFMDQYYSVYDKLREALKDKWRSKIKVGAVFSFGTGYELELNEDSLVISNVRGEELLFVEDRDAASLLLEGSWWELIVADAVQKWGKGREMWMNVKLDSENKPQKLKQKRPDVKNEIDVLVNLDTVMLFIECKSGTVTQTDVNKMNSLENMYGGSMAKSLLVSYFRLNNQDLLSKCKDLNIDVYVANEKERSTAVLSGLITRLDKLASKKKAG